MSEPVIKTAGWSDGPGLEPGDRYTIECYDGEFIVPENPMRSTEPNGEHLEAKRKELRAAWRIRALPGESDNGKKMNDDDNAIVTPCLRCGYPISMTPGAICTNCETKQDDEFAIRRDERAKILDSVSQADLTAFRDWLKQKAAQKGHASTAERADGSARFSEMLGSRAELLAASGIRALPGAATDTLGVQATGAAGLDEIVLSGIQTKCLRCGAVMPMTTGAICADCDVQVDDDWLKQKAALKAARHEDLPRRAMTLEEEMKIRNLADLKPMGLQSWKDSIVMKSRYPVVAIGPPCHVCAEPTCLAMIRDGEMRAVCAKCHSKITGTGDITTSR